MGALDVYGGLHNFIVFLYVPVVITPLPYFVDHHQKKNVVTLAERRKARGDGMKAAVTVGGLCRKLGMSRQNYYQGRRERFPHCFRG
jgi:hypothetical protein